MTPSDALGRQMHPRKALRDLTTAGLLGLVAPIAYGAPIFIPDDQPTGWVTRPALSSTDLRSGSAVIYRADYKAGIWTGTVRANHISATGTIQNTSPWTSGNTASALAGVSWDTGRRIVTRNSSGTAIPFRWTSLDATQKAMLGASVASQQAVLNYVRGDRSNESPVALKLRARDSVQGDIQHSTLLYWNHSGGVRRLYVGGNDGMLHAFDAATGAEVFAYVPSMLLSRLPRLTTSPYAHTLFVDGGLAAADVQTSAGSRTLLAGSLGGGGRALFMLDVTNPAPGTEAAAAAMVKWEITSSTPGFANLGYTYAAPRLARLGNGTAAVIVGNGYLNTGHGRASLFVINAETGASICEIDTGVGSAASPNGLSTATLVDTDADGKVDLAYAGDLDGRLWRFDLRGSAAPACSATALLTTSPQQSITTAPVVIRHPKGGRMVLTGTGRTLSAIDAADRQVHIVYGVWDGAPAANLSWLEQTTTDVTVAGKRLRTVTANQPDWASGGHRGWRLSLPAGERVLGENAFVSDDRFYFTTTNPTVGARYAGDADGANWLMEVQAMTGGSPASAIFDMNGDGKVDAADNVAGAVVVGQYLGEGVTSQAVLTDQASLGQTLLNRQSDIDYSPPDSPDEAGVSGGHFDPDFYAAVSGKLTQLVHHHEYDDTYDVTGVNFLNASDSDLNLSKRLGAGVPFKVLVMNQYLNPAAQLSVGGSRYTNIRYYGGMTETTDASSMLAAQPSYTLATVQTLTFNLPMDAFASKDWWRDGGAVRSGLIPTTTGCVNKVNADGSTPTLGPNGERHNGAFTVQIIKAETPDSAIELNYPGGGARYGWRVKAGLVNTYVLAEYTVFWHHPNGKCYGGSGWVQNAPQDFDGRSRIKAGDPGSADPRDGSFGTLPKKVTLVSTTTSVSGNVTTIVLTYSDGKTHRTVSTELADGSEQVATTDRDGKTTTSTRAAPGRTEQGIREVLQPSRRINWRELVRQ
jgi:Tfp pilus tip-associated adhesin PilY1